MLISKETIIGAAALGAGAIAAKVVHSHVIAKAMPTATSNVKNAVTLVAGILTPMLIKGPIGTGLGAGMIATSVAGLIDPILVQQGITIGGYGDTFLGDVYSDYNDSVGSVLMGNSADFTSPTNDFTSEGAGEMNY
jgi:hypothetical protein